MCISAKNVGSQPNVLLIAIIWLSGISAKISLQPPKISLGVYVGANVWHCTKFQSHLTSYNLFLIQISSHQQFLE